MTEADLLELPEFGMTTPTMFLYTAGEEIGARAKLGIAIFPPTGLRDSEESLNTPTEPSMLDSTTLADLPGLKAQDAYFVIGSAAYRRDSSFQGRKAIIARSTDGKIQTIQKEDTMTQTTGTQRSSEQADAIRPFHESEFSGSGTHRIA